jgi:hypothetical protein
MLTAIAPTWERREASEPAFLVDDAHVLDDGLLFPGARARTAAYQAA